MMGITTGNEKKWELTVVEKFTNDATVLLASTCCNYFRFYFPFLRAAVGAVSLVRPVPLFLFSLLCCMVCYGTNKDR